MTTPSDLREPPTRRVLVVEDSAHRAAGHFAFRFAEIARCFAALGCDVDVLTAQGWALEPEGGAVGFTMHRYGPTTRFVGRVAHRLRTQPGSGWWARTRRWVGASLRVVLMLGAARSVHRRIGRGTETVVISYGVDPLMAASVAGRGRWFLYDFKPPAGDTPPRRVMVTWARLAEARRRRAGGRFALATSTERAAAEWRSRAPFLDPVALPIAGTRTCTPIPGARDELGLGADERVALAFGSRHQAKAIRVIWRAFARLPDWRLLVVGAIADRYAADGSPELARPPVLIGGFVDERTRDLAYSAADASIVSFKRHHDRDSGVLMDALSWAVPVVCSDGSPAADIVRTYRLGPVFAPEDEAALVAAMGSVPEHLDADDLDRVRVEFADEVLARAWLEHLHPGVRVQADGA